MARIFPKLTATTLQAATYLLGIALFSIAFLVFLNSSISFVITNIIGRKKGVGDAAGTLGFADELLALVACPFWGLVSDRIGVRTVAVVGYCIVGVSLVGLVQAKNVYPELLFGRLLFSIGGAACSTMVTAVLPAMVAERTAWSVESDSRERGAANGHAARLLAEERDVRRSSLGHGAAGSVDSEITITQSTYTTRSGRREQRVQLDDSAREEREDGKSERAGTSQLAGFVGLFTGAGALVALALFLPMPAHFQDRGLDQAESLQFSYYIVAAVAFCVAIFIFVGLRNLPGEDGKSFSALLQRPYDESTGLDREGNLHTTLTPAPSYFALVKDAVKLGVTDSSIFLGYVGGFVARASSVAISLFIPMFVNDYFKRTGLCTSDGYNIPDIKKNCERAYTLASALAGIAETAALLCAPLFGWLGGKVASGNREWPLLGAAVVGVGGYTAFGLLRNPDAFHGQGGQWALLAVVLIGISQIGSIVCSLGLLGRGINHVSHGDRRDGGAKDFVPSSTASGALAQQVLTPTEHGDSTPLLWDARQGRRADKSISRSRLKGSIAGIYSFAGGAGILLLTKAGGALFDTWTPGAPFFLMAIFNGVLVVAVVGVSVIEGVKKRRSE